LSRTGSISGRWNWPKAPSNALEEKAKADGRVDEATLTTPATRFTACLKTQRRQLMAYLREPLPVDG